MPTLLYDATNSLYCSIARVALAENNVEYASKPISTANGEHLSPEYAWINPSMTIPSYSVEGRGVLTDSRLILREAYQQDETIEEKALLDLMYNCDAASFALLSGKKSIPLLNVMVSSGVYHRNHAHKLKAHQRANPELHGVYQRKIEAQSTKHFSKELSDVRAAVTEVVNQLERQLNAGEGPWLLGSTFSRVDCVASVWLQWVVWSNETGAAPVPIPENLLRLLHHAKARQSFHQAVGKYGKDAFVLQTIQEKNRKVGICLGLGVAIPIALMIRA